jgi:hypothetical protein
MNHRLTLPRSRERRAGEGCRLSRALDELNELWFQ